MSKTKAPTWTTRDGTVLLLSAMDDQHLVNTLKMLKRKAAFAAAHNARILLSGPQPHGEGAQMAFDQELMEAGNIDNFLHESYEDLIWEAKKRKLKYE
jgi:hypothetical protein